MIAKEYSTRREVLKDVRIHKLNIASAVKILRQIKKIEHFESRKVAA